MGYKVDVGQLPREYNVTFVSIDWHPYFIEPYTLTIHTANLLKIFTHNYITTVKTIKTAVKLASLLVAVMETALEVSRTCAQFNVPSSTRTESTTLTRSEESSISSKSTQRRRKMRNVVDKIET